MKTIPFCASVFALLLAPACNLGGGGKPEADLKSEKGRLSYAIGQQIGRQMKGQSIDIDSATLAASIDDAAAGRESKLKPEEMRDAMMKAQAAANAKVEAEGKANQEKGAAFLAQNKAKPGVKVTASGLQYETLTEGKGPSPKATDMVKVQYKGTLIDGKVFDSSYDRGQPAQFALNQVIPGWTEGLQLMKVGGKSRFVLPSDIAYGARGTPGIPPSSTLVFEVELLEIVKPSGK